jgi:hypothetical protein
MVTPPPPAHQLGRARMLPSAHTIFNHNFKHILKLFSMVTSSDLCLCTQLATSVSP